MSKKTLALLAAAATAVLGIIAADAETIDPAQALAQKFSEATDEPPAIAQPKTSPQKPSSARPPSSQRSFAAPGPDYEADMLERARAEDSERAAREATQLLATRPSAPPPTPQPPSSPPLVAVTGPAPTPLASTAAPVMPPLVSTAVPAPQHLLPAATIPAPVAVATPAPAPLVPVTAPAPPIVPLPAEKAEAPAPKLAALPVKQVADPTRVTFDDGPRPETTNATVLLVLDTDGGNFAFKPDPILCIDDRCWLSNGITSAAVALPRTQAVAMQSTSEATEDSCGGKSGCVFRDVPVNPTSRIDVIEVGEGGGASDGAYTLAADKSCRKSGEALVCDNGVVTQKFRIWVVPESTAMSAGTASLENAVAEGLPDSGTISANDK